MFKTAKLVAAEVAVKNINGQEIAKESIRSLADSAKIMGFVGKTCFVMAKIYAGISKNDGLINTLGVIIDRSKYIVAEVIRMVREDKVLQSAVADFNGSMDGALDVYKQDFEDLAKDFEELKDSIR